MGDTIYWYDQIRDWLPYLPVVLVVLGFCAGLLGSLLGLGGGWLIVPALTLFSLPAPYAVATSLATVAITTAFGVVRYHRRHLIDWPVARRVALPSMIGALVGGQALAFLDALRLADRLVGGIYLVILAFVIWSMLSGEKRRPDKSADAPAPSRSLYRRIGAASGVLAGFLGIGGGIILVPALARFTRLPTITAVTTSLLSVFFAALAGASVGAYDGLVEWPLALLLAGGSLGGTILGAHLAPLAREVFLRRLFAGVALATAVSLSLRLSDLWLEARVALFASTLVLSLLALTTTAAGRKSAYGGAARKA